MKSIVEDGVEKIVFEDRVRASHCLQDGGSRVDVWLIGQFSFK